SDLDTTALTWGKEYHWTAQVNDTIASSARSASSYFVPAVNQPGTTSRLGGSPLTFGGVEPLSRNFHLDQTDAVAGGAGPQLEISRSYNSEDPRTNLAFGAGMTSLLDVSIVADTDGSGNQLIT